MNPKDIFIGRHIKDFWISDNRTEMKFYTDDGTVVIECEPDCCSEAWIEHIDFPECLRDAMVVEVEEIKWHMLEEGMLGYSGRQLVDQIYFLKIRTTKGYATIDYRNSSNGYYGTRLNWSKE